MTSKTKPITALRLVPATTRASEVYDQLKVDILQGRLQADQKLKIEELSNFYSTGASPLREALNRLSAEGLVSRSDQRGFNVAPLHWEELDSLTETRCFIEGKALEESIQNRTDDWESKLALLIHKLSRTPRSLETKEHNANPEWELLHKEFHKTLLENAPSRWLKEFSETLSTESYRYRQVAASKHFGKRDHHAEHIAIFQAAINGDIKSAKELLLEHYRTTSTMTGKGAKNLKLIK
jgi:DNA-binding GntR family transcriptional regulator